MEADASVVAVAVAVLHWPQPRQISAYKAKFNRVGMYDRIHDIILPNSVSVVPNQEYTRAIRGTQEL
jgi:hypothetical protein